MKQNRKSFEISQKVIKFIEENNLIDPGSHIVVGLSGGADSVCLLHILKTCFGDKCSIQAVHVHHGIRKESADKDAEFAQKFCRELDVPITVVKRNIPGEASERGETCEECARRVRYEIFRELSSGEGDLIAVAHHIDDQAETVLFRMVRGTGIKGLGAMLPGNGQIIRPLLCLTREEILMYLKEQNLSYCIDETNEDINYSRNRIRHMVMPELQALCPEAASHIAMLSSDAREADDFLNECAISLYEDALMEFSEDEDSKKVIMDADILKRSKPIIIRMALRHAVDNLTHSLKDVTREHIEAVTELLNKDEYSSVNLPKNIVAVKEGKCLIFLLKGVASDNGNVNGEDCSENGGKTDRKTEDIAKGFFREIEVPGRIELPDGRILETAFVKKPNISSIPQNLYTKWFDYDKINAGFCVRTRREGDYIISDSAGSHKSISRYMIDSKIPKSIRDDILLVASGSEVYWVIGYRISESVKVDETTCHTIEVEIKEK